MKRTYCENCEQEIPQGDGSFFLIAKVAGRYRPLRFRLDDGGEVCHDCWPSVLHELFNDLRANRETAGAVEATPTEKELIAAKEE